MKDGLSGKIKAKFPELRARIYSYLIDEGGEDKKAKGTKKCVIKRKLKFGKLKLKLLILFKSNSTWE